MNHEPRESSFLRPEPDEPGPAPSGTLWLPYLFFRPRKFFTHFPRMATGFTVAYAAYCYGLAGALDRLEMQQAKSEWSTRPNPVAELISGSWGAYWAIAAVAGLLGALIYYGAGGWWYLVRLKWSGAADPDAPLARRVYIFASLVWALPMVLSTISSTVRCATPADDTELRPLDWLALFAMPWSTYVSYRGVRTVFATAVWRARIWFLILPGLLQSIILAVVVVGVLFLSVLGAVMGADVEHPLTVGRSAFELRHPGNWSVATADEDYDPDHEFLIEPMLDAGVRFEITEGPVDADAHTAELVEHYQSIFVGQGGDPFTTWGTLAGSGHEYEGTLAGATYRVRMFTASDERRRITVVEWWDVDLAEMVEPGFEQIRGSFAWK